MDHPNGGSRPLAEQSTVELIQLASEQAARLVRDELALARVELTRKGRNAGLGIGLFGGAAVFLLYGTAALVAAAILGLAQIVAGWLAALAVGGALVALAGLLALVGQERVRRALPPVPQRAVRSVRADIGAVTAAVRDSRGKQHE
jgi:Putative Actinobacterial Holin-X, holin superfamily III